MSSPESKKYEPQILELESQLGQAYLQNDRKGIKRLLNGIWWQFKGDLGEMPTGDVVKLSSLLSKYQEFGNRAQIERFREKILNRVGHVDDGRPKDPNRIVETLRTAKLVRAGNGIKVVFSDRMVHRANGRVETIKDGAE